MYYDDTFPSNDAFLTDEDLGDPMFNEEFVHGSFYAGSYSYEDLDEEYDEFEDDDYYEDDDGYYDEDEDYDDFYGDDLEDY